MNQTEFVDAKAQLTLKGYLEDNRDILTALGIFVAIVAACNNLSIKLLAAFISLSSFTCATLVLFEFWRKPKNQDLSLSIKFFRFAVSCLAIGFFLYWFTTLDAIYPDLLFFVLAILITEGLIWCTKIIKEKRKSFGEFLIKLKKRKILSFFLAFIIALMILAIARLIVNPIEGPIFKAAVWIIDVSNKIPGPIQ